MRVVLDARNLVASGGTGVATYAQTLSRAYEAKEASVSWLRAPLRASGGTHTPLVCMARLGRSCVGHRKIRRTDTDYEVADLYRVATVRYKTFSKITVLESDSRPSLMHWTSPLPIRWAGIPNVVTIHDLIPLLHPGLVGTSISNFKHFLQECCDGARAVVTVSEAVRADILACLDVPPGKVFNLSQAVTFDEAMLEASRRVPTFCPDGGFLYFGLLDRRKNIARLIRAHGLSGTRRPLILIGALGHGSNEILMERYRHPRPEHVHILPWVSREALIGAIKRARAVVFPSLAEGFGLPIVEAMTLGTPVLTSAGHATEEIAGGAALLVPCREIDALVSGLRELDKDDALIERFRTLGLERARAFSMSAYSSRLADFYRGLATT